MDFNKVVGQKMLLKSAKSIEDGRVGHAYIFTGLRASENCRQDIFFNTLMQ